MPDNHELHTQIMAGIRMMKTFLFVLLTNDLIFALVLAYLIYKVV